MIQNCKRTLFKNIISHCAQDLNRDGLAFDPDIELKDENDRVIGDIAICMDVIRQESMEQNKLITHHFYHLFIHGILHLLGFVHNSKKEASIMEGMEISLLKKIGIADPY